MCAQNAAAAFSERILPVAVGRGCFQRRYLCTIYFFPRMCARTLVQTINIYNTYVCVCKCCIFICVYFFFFFIHIRILYAERKSRAGFDRQEMTQRLAVDFHSMRRRIWITRPSGQRRRIYVHAFHRMRRRRFIRRIVSFVVCSPVAQAHTRRVTTMCVRSCVPHVNTDGVRRIRARCVPARSFFLDEAIHRYYFRVFYGCPITPQKNPKMRCIVYESVNNFSPEAKCFVPTFAPFAPPPDGPKRHPKR